MDIEQFDLGEDRGTDEMVARRILRTRFETAASSFFGKNSTPDIAEAFRAANEENLRGISASSAFR